MASERFTGLAAVLNAIRDHEGITQPELVERVGLRRSTVAQRVAELEVAGLVASDGLGPSTGGRAPRRLQLCAAAGFVLGIDIASSELVVGIADLAGSIRSVRHEHVDLGRGPEATVGVVDLLCNDLIAEAAPGGRVLSVVLGMPEPVAFTDGNAVALPTMPDWDRYPLQEHLAALTSAVVRVDDRVNLLALGERRINPVAARSEHMLYVGGGVGIGAAMVVDGRVYRGATGLAGAIGHSAVPAAGETICRCGNVGCLETVVGGAALSRDGRLLAQTGQSPALAAVLTRTGVVRPIDITVAAEHGDGAAASLLARAATLIGASLATLVNALNPDLVVIGGGIARARAHVLDAVRESIRRHALPATNRNLRVELSVVDEERAGVIGAVQSAIDDLLSPGHLSLLLETGYEPSWGARARRRTAPLA